MNKKIEQAAPLVTVDAPEFGALLTRLNMCAGQKEIDRTRKDIIRSADAHTARAVAAAHQAGRLEAHNLHKRVTFKAMAERDDALPRTQPVAGELPPLPAGWIVRKDDDGGIVVQKHGVGGYAARSDDDNIASTILHAFASDLLAAQPMQQPAAVLDIVDLAALTVYNFAHAGLHPTKEFFSADDVRALFTAPVPAAGVQPQFKEVGSFLYVGVEYVATSSDDPRGIKLYRPVDAAGVQGDGELVKRLTHERDALGQAIADAALKAGMYNGEVDLTGPHLIMFAQHLGEAAQQQPDSGRDAALRVLESYAENYDMMARIVKGRTVDCTAVAYDIRRNMVDGVRKALAAQPAPSSDAGLDEVQRLLEREQRDAQGLASLLRKERERFQFLHSSNKDADGWEWGVARVRIVDGKVEYLWGVSDHSDIDSILAAHPANGAQAGLSDA